MNDLKSYFNFNRGERIAIIIISIFIIIEIVLLICLNSNIFNVPNLSVKSIEQEFEKDSISFVKKNNNINNIINYSKNKQKVNNKLNKLSKKIEINSCDTGDLYLLRGIGWVYAKRIIKYRNLLGGFVRKEQLLEVYGIDKDRYDLFSDDIYVDTNKIRKININDNDIKTLGKHPYIGFEKAYKIIKYRKKNGLYNEISQLLNIIDTAEYLKICKYVDIK